MIFSLILMNHISIIYHEFQSKNYNLDSSDLYLYILLITLNKKKKKKKNEIYKIVYIYLGRSISNFNLYEYFFPDIFICYNIYIMKALQISFITVYKSCGLILK